MIDFKKIRKWAGLSQIEMANAIGIKQGSYSGIERGKSAASAQLESLTIERFTPRVMFINHSKNTPTIINAMLGLGQVDTAEHDPKSFVEAMKQGLNIAVITNDKEPFLEMIKQTEINSGLNIPVRSIFVDEQGRISS